MSETDSLVFGLVRTILRESALVSVVRAGLRSCKRIDEPELMRQNG